MASKVAQCSPGESETFESSSRMQLAEQVLCNWMIKFMQLRNGQKKEAQMSPFSAIDTVAVPVAMR